MRQFLAYPFLILVVALASAFAQEATTQTKPQSSPHIEVYFSPGGGCTEAIVKELNSAKTSVVVQAYSFTSVPIAKALVEAHKREVKVEVILDKSQQTQKYSEADFLVNMGISTKIDSRHTIAHNKVMVIDDSTVITGSFNFTKQAENSNAENLLVIRSPELASKYSANWKSHADHSDIYEQKTEGFSQVNRSTEIVGPAPPAVTSATKGFVASQYSQVFHKAGCSATKKISVKNLIYFDSHEKAVESGKRPCKTCNP